MKKIVVVTRNLMDYSKIENGFRRDELEFVKFSNLGKLFELIDSCAEGITALVDFSLFEAPDDIVELVPNSDDENVNIVIFGPHELMRELAKYYPTITFVARSAFFKDVSKYV